MRETCGHDTDSRYAYRILVGNLLRNVHMKHRKGEGGLHQDESGSSLGSCPTAGHFISDLQTQGSTTAVLVNWLIRF